LKFLSEYSICPDSNQPEPVLLSALILWVNEKFWTLLIRVRIVKPMLFQSTGVFMATVLTRHGFFLSGLLRVHLSLPRLVVFLDIHSLILVHSILDLIMTLFGVACVIVLTMR